MFFQRFKSWSVWSAQKKAAFKQGQQTISGMWNKESVTRVLALLQEDHLPETFTGPSHDFIQSIIEKVASRLEPLQDTAMSCMTTNHTMKGDHTFKVAGLCRNQLGNPFTALHTVMGDKAIILSSIFAKDETIASLRGQHAEIKERHIKKNLPPPLVYAVDKCCQFIQLQDQIELSPSEKETMLAAAKMNGQSDAAINDLEKRLQIPPHMQQDLMHLHGRYKRGCGFMDSYKEACLNAYRTLFWEVTDVSHQGKHYTSVPQNARRIPNPTDLTAYAAFPR